MTDLVRYKVNATQCWYHIAPANILQLQATS